eukprot:1134489-Pelagomonas_calceolata.AAC.5
MQSCAALQAYGDNAMRVIAMAEEEGLGKRLIAGHPILEAEVMYTAKVCGKWLDGRASESRGHILPAGLWEGVWVEGSLCAHHSRSSISLSALHGFGTGWASQWVGVSNSVGGSVYTRWTEQMLGGISKLDSALGGLCAP